MASIAKLKGWRGCFGPRPSRRPLFPRHCERSEAIHLATLAQMDCFAALAMTAGYDFAISRRISPEVCIFVCPLSIIRGRREDRVHAAPAVSRANCAQKTRTRAYRFSGNTPAFPAQWLYGLLRALPGERLFCHRRSTMLDSSKLDASTAASGPHDFAVRIMRALVLRAIRVHRISPRVRDVRTPLVTGETARNYITDLPDGASGIFLRGRLDDPNHVESSGEIHIEAQPVFQTFSTCTERPAFADLPDVGQGHMLIRNPPASLQHPARSICSWLDLFKTTSAGYRKIVLALF